MKSRYEAWFDEENGSLTFALPEQIEMQRKDNLLSDDAKLLHVVFADTPEEAMAVHNIKMGWGAYNPPGESEDCPNGCGAKYYPKGSGVCPNCGRIC